MWKPAENVLRADDTGTYTVPSRTTYPHQWNWDSALIALGWAELDPARAWTELETLMGAREDATGMVPHIAFHTRVPDRLGGTLRGVLTQVARPNRRYMPGPIWWGKRVGFDGRRISGITQPPVAATCTRLLFEAHPAEPRARALPPPPAWWSEPHPAEPRARALLQPLIRWHRFLMEERDPLHQSEPTVIHPWETGRDNAVEWDVPLWRVVPEVTVLHRRDTESVKAAERPTDEHYRRYLTLVRRGTASGWDQERLARTGAFRVLDPGFSAVLARAAADLAWLAEALGEDRLADESAHASEHISSALRGRSDSDGLIRPVDLTDGTTLHLTSAGSALALLTPGLDGRQVAAARDVIMDGALA